MHRHHGFAGLDHNALAQAVYSYAGPIASGQQLGNLRGNQRVPTEAQQEASLEIARQLRASRQTRRLVPRGPSSKAAKRLPDDYDSDEWDVGAEELGSDDDVDDFGPQRLAMGRAQQPYDQQLQASQQAWAEARPRIQANAVANAAQLQQLHQQVCLLQLQQLQQHLDAYPKQHACCSCASASGTEGAAVVTVCTTARQVIYVGPAACGTLQVPTFSCSFCGSSEVPPEVVGCIASAPLRGRTWYDAFWFQVSTKA
jgi:hypothetical protein